MQGCAMYCSECSIVKYISVMPCTAWSKVQCISAVLCTLYSRVQNKAYNEWGVPYSAVHSDSNCYHLTPDIIIMVQYTVLHCTALHCTALHCLHWTVLHFTSLNCTWLYCTAKHYNWLQSAVHCSVLNSRVGKSAARHWTAVHCSVNSVQWCAH